MKRREFGQKLGGAAIGVVLVEPATGSAQPMRVLRDTQFAGAICPDHMPRHADDPDGLQAFAFGYGYIKALIQAVNAEV